MADMQVPGVGAGKYDNLVDALMKKERIPRDRVQEQLDLYQNKRDSLRSVNAFSADVRAVARSLYSFANPFSEKVTTSSDPTALTATATRDASNQQIQISVQEVASQDAFLSEPVSKDVRIEAGTYTFSVGDVSIPVEWKGGTYPSFIQAVNKKAGAILTISEVKTNIHETALLFRSKVLGAKNRLTFSDDALPFALKIGLIQKGEGRSEVHPSQTDVVVKPLSKENITFSVPVRAKKALQLEFIAQVHFDGDFFPQAPEHAQDEGQKQFEDAGEASYQDVTIKNEKSKVTIPLAEIPEYPQKKYEKPSFSFFALESTRGVYIPVSPISETDKKQHIVIPLSEYGDVKSLRIKNENTHATLELSDIVIKDPAQIGEYVPVNPVSIAQDARIIFDGIEITRPTNEITDLIPSLTLNIHQKTDTPLTLSVEPNREAVKNAIIEFVGKYNRLIAEINIVTEKKPEIIDELQYLSEPEKETAHKRLGSLYSDITLNTLKNTLRSDISAFYPNTSQSPLHSLSQIGIATKTDFSGAVDRSRLRGYLEINEKELDKALATDLIGVKELFGVDTNNDRLVDTGVAHAIYERLTPYIERGGIFATKDGAFSTQITATEKKIETLDERLAKKEQQLRRQYNTMDGTLRSLQKQSDAMRNFNGSSGGGR